MVLMAKVRYTKEQKREINRQGLHLFQSSAAAFCNEQGELDIDRLCAAACQACGHAHARHADKSRLHDVLRSSVLSASVSAAERVLAEGQAVSGDGEVDMLALRDLAVPDPS